MLLELRYVCIQMKQSIYKYLQLSTAHKTNKQINFLHCQQKTRTHSCKWGNAPLSSSETYLWMYSTLVPVWEPGVKNWALICPCSTTLNMYAKIVACIVKPEGREREKREGRGERGGERGRREVGDSGLG